MFASNQLASSLLTAKRLDLQGGSRALHVGSDGAAGQLTLSVSVPSGVQSGDMAVYFGSTRNSIPDANGPEGDNSWTELARYDVLSSEFHFFYWKTCDGSEPSTWDLTISDEGTDDGGCALISVFRGPSSLHDFQSSRATENTNRPTPGAEAHPRGLVVLGWVTSFNADALTFSNDPAITLDASAAVGGTNPRAHTAHYDSYATQHVGDGMGIGRFHQGDNTWPLESTNNFTSTFTAVFA